MIKIRYSDLPAGRHLTAEVRGKHTVLFLLPGLTAAQRKAAIRRARSAARIGHGPALPALGLARAITADRIATTVRNGLAAMRMHPAIFIPPLIIMVSVAITYVLLVSFSIRFLPPQSGPHLVLPGGSGHSAVHKPRTAGPGSRPASGAVPGSAASPGPSPSRRPGSRSPSPSASPSPTPPGRRTPGPSPSAPVPSPSGQPSPGPSTGSGSGGGVCLKVGLLGVCLPL